VAAVVAFDAVAFAEKFWRDQLAAAAARAPGASTLLADLRRDPAAAAKIHSHRVGLGNAAFYFGRGTGRVTAVERNRLLIELDGAVVALRAGPVFGNVVRDGCGLLDVNKVPGLAEFNALSAELNRLVEARVQPPLKTVAVGATITFAGCAEAPESLPAAGPLLTFIPVTVEVTP
jgi:predicted lipoprotein